MLRGLLLIILFVTASFSAGCSILGVYDNEFKCPATYNGRCISMQGAYDLAKKGQDSAEFDPDAQAERKDGCGKDGSSCGGKVLTPVVTPENTAHTSYKESLFKKFDGLLKEPTTPVVAPPQVMRVLLLPYRSDGNELFMLRYVYFFVDEPRWVLGDSVVDNEED